MDLDHWRLFVKVAELGSLSKAAGARDTAQPVVSRQVAALERYCGVRLFHRNGRGAVLTEAGKRIFARAKAWTEEGDQLAKEVRASIQNPVGVVRVGTIESVSHSLIGLLFRRSRERFPDVQLRVFDGSSGQLSEDLDRGQIDIGVVFRYGRDARPEDSPLLNVDTCLIGPAGDALTRAPTVEFAKLHGLPLILPGVPNTLRVVLDQIARRKRVSLSVVMESESLVVQKEVVAGRGGYTLLGTHAVVRELRSGTLQASRIVSPGIERKIALSMSRHHPATLASREVAKLIRECAGELAGTAPWKQRK